MAVMIREMTASDTTSVANLCLDLGYEATALEVKRRLSVVVLRPDNSLFVAEAEGKIIGWVHAYGVRLLETDGYVEIGGVVVKPECQRQHIGTQLVRECERWAVKAGYTRVRLRSGVHREDAHLFYESIGYKKSRASFAFERFITSAM